MHGRNNVEPRRTCTLFETETHITHISRTPSNLGIVGDVVARFFGTASINVDDGDAGALLDEGGAGGAPNSASTTRDQC